MTAQDKREGATLQARLRNRLGAAEHEHDVGYLSFYEIMRHTDKLMCEAATALETLTRERDELRAHLTYIHRCDGPGEGCPHWTAKPKVGEA